MYVKVKVKGIILLLGVLHHTHIHTAHTVAKKEETFDALPHSPIAIARGVTLIVIRPIANRQSLPFAIPIPIPEKVESPMSNVPNLNLNVNLTLHVDM